MENTEDTKLENVEKVAAEVPTLEAEKLTDGEAEKKARLWERMRRVKPEMARQYRQQGGE